MEQLDPSTNDYFNFLSNLGERDIRKTTFLFTLKNGESKKGIIVEELTQSILLIQEQCLFRSGLSLLDLQDLNGIREIQA